MAVDLSIRKIRSFMVVAELNSFRRAAEQIHISPPALSTHIKELEETIGVPLLYRTTRNVELTEEGTRFLERIRPLFAGLDSVIEEFKEEADLLRGRLAIACLPTIISHFLPPMLRSLQERHPGIKLRVFDLGFSAMLEAVKSGEADLGIGGIPANHSEFDIEPFFEDGFVALVPAGHPLANKRRVKFEELSPYPFIGLKKGTSIRNALDHAMSETGTRLNIAHELIYHYTVGSMVQAGFGVSAFPSLAFPKLNFPDVIAIPVTSPNLVRKIGVIRRKGGGITPSVREFLSMLTEVRERLSPSSVRSQ